MSNKKGSNCLGNLVIVTVLVGIYASVGLYLKEKTKAARIHWLAWPTVLVGSGEPSRPAPRTVQPESQTNTPRGPAMVWCETCDGTGKERCPYCNEGSVRKGYECPSGCPLPDNCQHEGVPHPALQVNLLTLRRVSHGVEFC